MLNTVPVGWTEETMSEMRTPALLSRAEAQRIFGWTGRELQALIRRPDFVRLCCITSESDKVIGLVVGQVQRWLRDGSWDEVREQTHKLQVEVCVVVRQDANRNA